MHYQVTNLDDYHPVSEAVIPCSLRWACSQPGPSVVTFGVAGNIDLHSSLEINTSNLTVDGSTSPAGGICIRRRAIRLNGVDSVVLKHLRIRCGDRNRAEVLKTFAEGCLWIGNGSTNVLIEHCSIGWGTDQCVTTWGNLDPARARAGTRDIALRHCLIAESLNNTVHPESPHGHAALLMSDGVILVRHCVVAHHLSRAITPGKMGCAVPTCDFRNNLLYDCSGYADLDVNLNYVGNTIVRPNSEPFRMYGDTPNRKMYVLENTQQGSDELDQWKMITGNREAPAEHQAAVPFAVDLVPRNRSADTLLALAGATLPRRDSVDQRVIQQVLDGTGGLIDSQEDVGGYPSLQ